MYLQDIIKHLSGNNVCTNYPEPRSRQESYLQYIISKIDSAIQAGGIQIIDETANVKYIGNFKIVNGKPVLFYKEIKKEGEQS